MIPFDSLVLRIVVEEVQELIGKHAARIWTPDAYTAVLEIGKKMLLMSCDPRFYRVHLCFARPNHADTPLSDALRRYVKGARLVGIEQVGFDRRCLLRFERGGARVEIDARQYGTRSDIVIRVDGKDLFSARRQRAPSLPEISFEEAMRSGRGLSEFLKKELELQGKLPETSPVWYPGFGAYAFPCAQLDDRKPMPMATMSGALAKNYEQIITTSLRDERAEQLRKRLTSALHAKRHVLSEMEKVRLAGDDAKQLQLEAELLLAHGSQFPSGGGVIEVQDYDGKPLRLTLQDGDYVAAADRLFAKAKQAKASAKAVSSRIEQVRSTIEELEGALKQIEREEVDVEEIERSCIERGLLRAQQAVVPKEKKERKFEGHRIREVESPEGRRVLWGESASANDYLSTKLARPNDYWFHVRGAQGAHVLLRTENQPERVQKSELLFAAKIAAARSNQKHAKHVPVSYTLAKYVRKPRKAPPGTVTITHEKTIFVDP